MKVLPQLRHVGIYVQDIEAMREYYCNIFELVLTDRGISPSMGRPIVFLSANATAHHQLVLVGGRDQKTEPSTINQLSFQVDDFPGLRTIYERLQTVPNTTIRPVDHGNAWSLYTQDPEGNGIEVFVDTPWHVAQPHARTIDMTLSDAEIFDITRAAVLLDPTYAEREDWSQALGERLAQT